MRTTAGMLAWVGIVGLVACNGGKSGAVDAPPAIHDGSHDGMTFDALTRICTAPTGSANVTFETAGTPTTFTRLDAGGLWMTGPVHGFTEAPMSISLLFTNADPLTDNVAQCCAQADLTCCPVEGIVATSEAITWGSEVGTHPVSVKSFRDHSLTLPGSVTITSFVHPFDSAPGRIAGSISVQTDLHTISGTFDHTFCAALLNATI